MKIEFNPGTTYDPAHLRAFDLEMAKAGHPLAYANGSAARCFRFVSPCEFTFDVWHVDENQWRGGGWNRVGFVDIYLCLAPLCVKDGRALHVGDEIEIKFDFDPRQTVQWLPATADINHCRLTLDAWRWPERKE